MISALFFDVFGTLLDWRSSVARDAKALLHPLGHDLDFAQFADAWRAEYQPSMEEVRSGRRPYEPLDTLHRENLDRILPKFGLDGISPEMRDALSRLWHKLDAWPDVPGAMRRLHARFRLAPVSNGNISIMVDVARHNGFSFDAVLGADIARTYKPRPEVYLASARSLDLSPSSCMMVAAHSADLKAASACGLKTAHVARLDEYGPGSGETKPAFAVDLAARDLGELADMLNA